MFKEIQSSFACSGIIAFGLAHLEQSTCTRTTRGGAACRRRVNTGERYCWQHASGLKQKWQSLTRNQTMQFLLGVIGLICSVVPLLFTNSSSSDIQAPQARPSSRVTVGGPPQGPSTLAVGTDVQAAQARPSSMATVGGLTQGSSTLAVGMASGIPGAVIDIPITLKSEQHRDVCGIQFDLTFPSQLAYVDLAPGPSAIESNHSVSGATLSSGGARVLTIGLGSTCGLKSGVFVIVRLKISRSSSSAHRPLALVPVRVVASTPDGKESPISASSGEVYVKSRSQADR